ncbi:hypothetical protein ACFWEB_36125, partial [Streptomyces parvus]|uniref:hypothetical protein n=1 Tax=Streptomyces parvus TaxID=66428 RepID=UPI00364E8978
MRRTVLEHFPAGDPRGSRTAEEFAARRRGEGLAAEVVMDLDQDAFLVIVEQQETLVEVGPQGASADHSANPTSLQD